jgi:mRNA-degrading endonuclease toxin of MazEF toxin-antitoxin module
LAPITTKPKGHAFEIPLPIDSRVKGVVIVHQLKSFDWPARRARHAATVSDDILAAAAVIINDSIEG